MLRAARATMRSSRVNAPAWLGPNATVRAASPKDNDRIGARPSTSAAQAALGRPVWASSHEATGTSPRATAAGGGDRRLVPRRDKATAPTTAGIISDTSSSVRLVTASAMAGPVPPNRSRADHNRPVAAVSASTVRPCCARQAA
jgi:hypothetical protein